MLRRRISGILIDSKEIRHLPGRKALVAGAAVLILGLLLFQLLTYHTAAGRRVGIGLEVEGKHLLVTGIQEGGPAHRAGLQRGDVLVALDGRAVVSEVDYDLVARGFERGRPVAYTLRRGGEERTLAVTPGTGASWLRRLLNVFAVLCYLALAALALLQPLSDLRTRLLGILALAIAAELTLPLGSIGVPWLAVAANVAFYFLTGLECATELHLVSMIPERRPFLVRRPWLASLYYVLGLGFAALASFIYLASQLRLPSPLPFSAGDVSQFLGLWFLPGWALAVVLLLGATTYGWPQIVGRQQAALILLGTFPWAALTVFNAVRLRRGIFNPDWLNDLESVALICLPIAVFVAIFRSHLFNLQLVVRRSLVYTALTSLLVLLFYTGVGIGGALFSELVDGMSSVWVVGGATLVSGLLFSPLKTRLQNLIDHRFFPQRDALRQRLIALAGELPTKARLPAMGRHLVDSLCDIFGTRTASLLLAHQDAGPLVTVASVRDETSLASPPLFVPLADPGVERLVAAGQPVSIERLAGSGGSFARLLRLVDGALVAPLLHQQQLVGVLVLGPKANGRSFPGDEVEMLALLAHHVATVLENARLFEAVTDDGLTGLLRREAILERLGLELQRAQRHQRPLTVGMLDLDHFKQVNDRHGHLAGDGLLRAVAQALRTEIRTSDSIGRYGGEEFLLVLPETDLEGARQVADKLRRTVAEVEVEAEDGARMRTTLSTGLASLWETPQLNGTMPQALIAAADQALYRAKSAGRNRVEAAAG